MQEYVWVIYTIMLRARPIVIYGKRLISFIVRARIAGEKKQVHGRMHAEKGERRTKKHTPSEKLLRLIYDFRGFENPADLDLVVFICNKFRELGYSHEDFEFLSFDNIKSSKLGWELFKLSSLGLIETGSIYPSEKGKKYVEKNISDIDFSDLAKALGSIGKTYWGWLAAFYFIQSLSESNPQVKRKFEIHGLSKEQLDKTKELDQRLRSLLT